MAVSVVSGDRPQNRRSSLNHNRRVNGAQIGGMPKLLAHRGLSDAECISDLALGHPCRQHGPESDDAPESRHLFVAARVSVLSNQRHK